jgi:hypothetical protein
MLAVAGKALKEWAVVVRAMDLGLQTILLRKGGIVEENRRFSIDAGEFFLLPTYTHQEPVVLQDRFRYLMEDPFCQARQDGLVPITHWAKLVDVLVVRSLEELEALSPHYIWSADYAIQRFRWKPRHPLNLLLLRVYRLPDAHLVPWSPDFGGCRSWAEIGGAAAFEGNPVLSDSRFEAQLGEILRILGRA